MLSSIVTADVFVRDDIITNPVYHRFSVCQEHTCQQVVTVSLSRAEWNEITLPIQEPLPVASEERAAIAATISNMEAVVGQRTGTYLDKGGNFAGFGQPGQMDCIDESTNTTTYITMLAEQNMLLHHTVADRATRFGIFAGAPHTTAVIRENSSGHLYAVDSWFFDNGVQPVIIDLPEWKSGWTPVDDPHE